LAAWARLNGRVHLAAAMLRERHPFPLPPAKQHQQPPDPFIGGHGYPNAGQAEPEMHRAPGQGDPNHPHREQGHAEGELGVPGSPHGVDHDQVEDLAAFQHDGDADQPGAGFHDPLVIGKEPNQPGRRQGHNNYRTEGDEKAGAYAGQGMPGRLLFRLG
jgi:hypothetical protein